MKTLFHVHIESVYFALAETREEAEDLFRKVIRDLDAGNTALNAEPATARDLLAEPEWRRGIPYGRIGDDRTCEQLLGPEAMAAAEAAQEAWMAEARRAGRETLALLDAPEENR